MGESDNQDAEEAPLTSHELCEYGFAALGLKKYTVAEKFYRRAAERGYATAQYNYAVMLKKSLCSPEPDTDANTEAAGYFSEAAAQGHARAAYQLGRAYYKGSGVQKNESEALRWFLKSTESGFEEAHHKAAIIYFEGRCGVAPDYAEAAQHFRFAAAKGHADASARLAAMLWKGFDGVPQSRAEATQLFAVAAEKGDAESMHIMGCLCLDGDSNFVLGSSSDGVEWLMKAARQGHEASQWRLCVLYKDMNDTENDAQQWGDVQQWLKTSIAHATSRSAHMAISLQHKNLADV
jgi:TPR repeat protein